MTLGHADKQSDTRRISLGAITRKRAPTIQRGSPNFNSIRPTGWGVNREPRSNC